MTDDTPAPAPAPALKPRRAPRAAPVKELPMPTPIDVLTTPSGALPPAYLADTSLFAQQLYMQRRAAIRAIEDLDSEMNRLHGEIDARLARRQGFEEIRARCDAALGLAPDRPAPQLNEREPGDE